MQGVGGGATRLGGKNEGASVYPAARVGAVARCTVIKRLLCARLPGGPGNVPRRRALPRPQGDALSPHPPPWSLSSARPLPRSSRKCPRALPCIHGAVHRVHAEFWDPQHSQPPNPHCVWRWAFSSHPSLGVDPGRERCERVCVSVCRCVQTASASRDWESRGRRGLGVEGEGP